jgi:hypothetical protein
MCSGFSSSETQTGEDDFRINLWRKVKSDSTCLRRYLLDISNISFINCELDWLGTGLQGFGFWQGKGFFSLPLQLLGPFLQKINWPKHEADPSLPSGVGVNMLGAIPPFCHILSKYGAWTQKLLYFH